MQHVHDRARGDEEAERGLERVAFGVTQQPRRVAKVIARDIGRQESQQRYILPQHGDVDEGRHPGHHDGVDTVPASTKHARERKLCEESEAMPEQVDRERRRTTDGEASCVATSCWLSCGRSTHGVSTGPDAASS